MKKPTKKLSLRDRFIALDGRWHIAIFIALSLGWALTVNQVAFGGDPRCLVVKCVVVK